MRAYNLTPMRRSTIAAACVLAVIWMTHARAQAPGAASGVTLYEGARLIAGDGNAPIETPICRLPVIEPISRHLEVVQRQHQADLARGCGRVVLPFALDRKYLNAADGVEAGSSRFLLLASVPIRDGDHRPAFTSTNPLSRRPSRSAARQAGITKRVGPHTFRHSFATQSARGWLRHSDRAGAAGPRRREHDDGCTTHVLDRGPLGVRSPVDRL